MGQEQSARASRSHAPPPPPARRLPAAAAAARAPGAAAHDERRRRPATRHGSADFDVRSDNSSTESSGYRSGSGSAYEYRSAPEHSPSSDYCRLSLYKNDHYKHINRELYRPVKIAKERRHRLELFHAEKAADRHQRIESYVDDAGAAADAKKCGIRNYTPKCLSDEERKIESWI